MNKRVKILVVEDEKFWFELLQLEAKHYPLPLSLSWALHGQEAIEMIKRGSRYDIIIMDLEMPLMDGIETTKRIRAFGNLTLIIAWSAYSRASKEELSLAAGMNGFIEKSAAPLLDKLLA